MLVRPIDRWLPWAVLCFLVASWPAIAPAQKRGSNESFEQARNRMVDEEVVGAGIKDPRVIQADARHTAA